ncbi:MAG: FHA domain-containing serine/threonine-protein kinase [Planctomycetota bacterium]|nr:FHA domain-containing serine/threonine-protein kinase [Planctomycetota bacterium]
MEGFGEIEEGTEITSGNFPSFGSGRLDEGDEVAGCLIKTVLGEGASGVVYRAEQVTLEREVAIKSLGHDLAGQDKVFHERFLREARTAARLMHPNIVQVYDAMIEDGSYYIIMEFVDGQTLDGLLENGKPLPLERAVDVFVDICEGLMFAHRQEIVHRDIKPANIMISGNGRVKLMDFGLAKAQGSNTLTVAGAVVGTPQYVSPEVCSGNEAGYPADIYSLGATFYHGLSGHYLFPGETPITVMVKQLKETPVSLEEIRPDAPKSLCQLVMQMLKKEPDERPANVEEIRDRLKNIKNELEEYEPPAQEPDAHDFDEPQGEVNRIPKARLMCMNGAIKGRKYPLRSEGTTSIGRLSENDIAILHASVSRRHAMIMATEGVFRVKDNGSANGCAVNGLPIKESGVKNGDIIRVGQMDFQFRSLQASEDACDLADILVEDGVLSQEDAGKALDTLTMQWNKGRADSLGQFLLKRGVLTSQELNGALNKLNNNSIQSVEELEEELRAQISAPVDGAEMPPQIERVEPSQPKPSSPKPPPPRPSSPKPSPPEPAPPEPPAPTPEPEPADPPNPFDQLSELEEDEDEDILDSMPPTVLSNIDDMDAEDDEDADWDSDMGLDDIDDLGTQEREKKAFAAFDNLDEEDSEGPKPSLGPVTNIFAEEDEEIVSPPSSLGGEIASCLRCGAAVSDAQKQSGQAREIDGRLLCPACVSLHG